MFISSNLSVNIDAQIIHVSENDTPTSSDYQFYLVQKGNIRIFFYDTGEKYELNRNDVIMIPPNANFCCNSFTSNTLLSIRIDSNYINSFIPYNYELKCNSVIDTRNLAYFNELSDIIIRICSTFFTNQGDFLLAALIYEFSYHLQQHFLFCLNENEESLERQKQTQKRISQIKEYMQSHYNEEISLQSLADEFYLTPQYLSKFFKKNLGTNFTAYLGNLRLERALIELLHSNNSITDIALGNGFTNVSTFNRIFRQKYEVTPSQYRQEYLDITSYTTPEELTVHNSSENTSKVPQSIHIDAATSSEYNMPWNNCINIGTFSNTLHNSFYTIFLEYQKNINVDYIRFTNMFDPDVLAYDSNIDEFDFTNIDVILGLFHRNNVYPFIELTYKPLKGSTVLHDINTDDLFKGEKSIDYYCKALSAFLKHSINNYGIDYVNKWKFEVWYKYQEKLIPLESFPQYSKRYERYYETIHQLVPDCKIGGPGFNICGNIQDFIMLLSELDAIDLPMDFMSFSAYSYELQTQYDPNFFTTPSSLGIISPNPDHIAKTFQDYQELLRKTRHFSRTESLITEFCSILSTENYIASSLFQATFLCHNMLSLIPYCKGVFYSYFMDSKRNLFLGNDHQIFFGIITENGIPKPALHAYNFLNHLGKYLISNGENYIFTQNSSNSYQLLCFNYVHFNRSYCFNAWDLVHIEQTYSVFQEGERMNMSFRCTNLPSGKYKVTQFSLNHAYGSILDKYIRILERGNITRKDLNTTITSLREDESNYYKQTCLPRQDIYFLNCEEELSINVNLVPHEVRFYEFTRIL
jgi:AraC-like DNA-binding protein/beta-xylosidase